MSKYFIRNISYCFPFCTRHFLPKEYWGVITEYDHPMTEDEADDLLCTIIKRKPFIKNCMYLNFSIIRQVRENCYEYYHTFNITNDNYDKANQDCELSPIQWKK